MTRQVAALLVARTVLEPGFAQQGALLPVSSASLQGSSGPVHIRIVVFKERLGLPDKIGER